MTWPKSCAASPSFWLMATTLVWLSPEMIIQAKATGARQHNETPSGVRPGIIQATDEEQRNVSDYKELDTVPIYEVPVWRHGKAVTVRADVLKWSAPFPLPPVGSEIVVTMNRIGPATVTGYFACEGWLGIRCRPASPPEWYVKQNGRDAEGYVYGAEIALPD